MVSGFPGWTQFVTTSSVVTQAQVIVKIIRILIQIDQKSNLIYLQQWYERLLSIKRTLNISKWLNCIKSTTCWRMVVAICYSKRKGCKSKLRPIIGWSRKRVMRSSDLFSHNELEEGTFDQRIDFFRPCTGWVQPTCWGYVTTPPELMTLFNTFLTHCTTIEWSIFWLVVSSKAVWWVR